MTRSDLIGRRAEPVTVIVWSPRFPFTKNQPPIVVEITSATAITKLAKKVPDRPSLMFRFSPFRLMLDELQEALIKYDRLLACRRS